MRAYPGRTAYRSLMIGSLVLIALAALTGLSLDLSPAALLAMHFAAAAAGAVFWLLSLPVTGGCGVAASATTATRPWATCPRRYWSCWPFRGLHCCGPPMWSRSARRTTQPLTRWLQCSARTACGASSGAGAIVLLTASLDLAAQPGWQACSCRQPWPSSSWCPVPHQRPSRRRRHSLSIRVDDATLGESNLPQVADCTGCHTDATQQWRSSLHAQAVTDEYYLAVATLFIEERGVEAVRYCAACHNPVGLDARRGRCRGCPEASRGGGNKAYESRGSAFTCLSAMPRPKG